MNDTSLVIFVVMQFAINICLVVWMMVHEKTQGKINKLTVDAIRRVMLLVATKEPPEGA